MESIENENLSTKVTEEEIEEGIMDDSWVFYSKDWKRLLCGFNHYLEYIHKYEIKNGTKIICDNAFCHRESLRQITIPDSVTSIGINAFAECYNLGRITIPNSVTSIGDGAFAICKNINIESNSFRFTITDKLLIDNVESRLISYFGANKCLIIPNSVKRIGNLAFAACKSLQQITFPELIESIGNRAFLGCESLLQITIPNWVTSIGDGAFTGCINLNIESNTYRFTITDKLLIDNVESRLISYFGSDKCLIIPNSVTDIGKYAFSGCTSLQHITIPDSVTSIADWAFGYCESLQKITIPDSVTCIEDLAFLGCESLQQIIIPEGTTEKFKGMLPKELWDKLYCLKKVE